MMSMREHIFRPSITLSCASKLAGHPPIRRSPLPNLLPRPAPFLSRYRRSSPLLPSLAKRDGEQADPTGMEMQQQRSSLSFSDSPSHPHRLGGDYGHGSRRSLPTAAPVDGPSLRRRSPLSLQIHWCRRSGTAVPPLPQRRRSSPCSDAGRRRRWPMGFHSCSLSAGTELQKPPPCIRCYRPVEGPSEHGQQLRG
ncbi:hypothetical protein PVAP13_5KG420312 [Panicum virgatum]|uniref:Uncharacterized protein n=1 Tax=Panicum virgatum TaxID=38727 RepID=A0A8T0SRE5_PANVG|nr:hypothetical protein PVAP13_5KG420312 [Panicum virgatum]